MSTEQDTNEERSKALISSAFHRHYIHLKRIAAFSMFGLNWAAFSASDFVMSAFKSCHRAMFLKQTIMDSESQLWSFLYKSTCRKVMAAKRHQMSLKCGGADLTYLSRKMEICLEDVEDKGPSPELIFEIREESQAFLELFADNPFFYKIIKWKLEGLSLKEIAQKLNICPRTVNYHLLHAKLRWLLICNCIDIIVMKFNGSTDEETAILLELPLDWVISVRRGILKLWSREEYNNYNSPNWIERIEYYFETGKINIDDEWPNIWKVHQSFHRILDQWTALIRGRWRRLLEEAWNQFEETR